MIRVGVDAGGTFTDFVAVGPGWYRELKRPSRPDDPAAVVLEALPEILPRVQTTVELVFSTTAATNALLERRGGPTLLYTTRGFEDVLEIGRQTRPLLYALEPQRVPPLVPAADRLGVDERVAHDGEVLRALDAEGLRVALEQARARPEATIAICFLHAYAAPEHERRLAEALRAEGRAVSVSSEVCPLPREYERSSTTVIDAYVSRALGATLAKLAAPRLLLRIMESSGGARAVREGSAPRPARALLSGPAAGVIAIEALARRRGLGAALALDIGGTSTDVALIREGAAARVDELTIDGLPIALPSVAAETVGAGGGSIAWLDAGGALKVGPRSAGAMPGPAAYGRGGIEPTVTDAHVVLGRLGGSICGGTVALDRGRAEAAIETIARPLRLDPLGAARAIVAVAEAAIARAVRRTSVGLPPAELTLVSYGGASGLHAVEVARALGISTLIVPPSPGLACARGALGADVVVDELASVRERLVHGLSRSLQARLVVLAERAAQILAEEGVHEDEREVRRLVRVRYEGQGIDGELELPALGLDREAFEAAHERAYGHRLDRLVEVVRLQARGIGRRALAAETRPREIGWPRRGTRLVDGAAARVYRRDRMAPGRVVQGPALVEELSATLWLPEGARAEAQQDGALVIQA